MTNEGPALWTETIEFLKTQDPVPPLEWNEYLYAAALSHVDDIGPKGLA